MLGDPTEADVVELERRLRHPRQTLDLPMLELKRKLATRVSDKSIADHQWEYVRGLADLDVDDDECIGVVQSEQGRDVLALDIFVVERWLREASLLTNRTMSDVVAAWSARGHIAERRGVAFGDRVVPCVCVWVDVLTGKR